MQACQDGRLPGEQCWPRGGPSLNLHKQYLLHKSLLATTQKVPTVPLVAQHIDWLLVLFYDFDIVILTVSVWCWLAA